MACLTPKSCYLIDILSPNAFTTLIVHRSGFPLADRDYFRFLGCLWRTTSFTVERSHTKGFSLCGLFALLTHKVENASVNFPLMRSDGVLSDINSFAGHWLIKWPYFLIIVFRQIYERCIIPKRVIIAQVKYCLV